MWWLLQGDNPIYKYIMQISSEDLLTTLHWWFAMFDPRFAAWNGPLAWCRDFSCRIWKQTEDGFQNHGQLEKAQKTWPTSPGVVLIWLLYLLYVKLISVLSAVKEVLATKSRLVGCISDLFYDIWSKKPVETAVIWLLYDSPASLGKYGTKTWGHWISCRYILIDSSFSLKERDVPWSWCFHMNGYGSSWKIQWLQEEIVIFGKTYVQLLC